ncbi:MAG: hypothetical protein OSB00_13495 [Sphingomonas bacterium]|nr:hypothetical protein [Sphingomonas bacterium]
MIARESGRPEINLVRFGGNQKRATLTKSTRDQVILVQGRSEAIARAGARNCEGFGALERVADDMAEARVTVGDVDTLFPACRAALRG